MNGVGYEICYCTYESGSVLEPAPKPIASPSNLSDRSLARSLAWNTACDWGSQIFTWLAFLVVMRLLTPTDLGIATLAVVLMPYLGQITGLGIPRAVVQLRGLRDDQSAQFTAVNITSGIVRFLLGVILAKPFAAFFKTPRLAPVFIVVCSGPVVGALCGVSSALLAKQMRFRLLSVLAATTALIAAIVTLVLALLGFGYWALVLGNLSAGLVRTIVILLVQPLRLAWPHFDSIRNPLRF